MQCTVCNKYRKCKKAKTSYIFENILLGLKSLLPVFPL